MPLDGQPGAPLPETVHALDRSSIPASWQMCQETCRARQKLALSRVYVGPSDPHENLAVWCRSRHVRAKVAVCQGVKMLSPGMFASLSSFCRTHHTYGMCSSSVRSVAHVGGCEPYHPHDLLVGTTSCVGGSVLHRSRTTRQVRIRAGKVLCYYGGP